MNEIGTPVSHNIIAREEEPHIRPVLDNTTAVNTRRGCQRDAKHLMVRARLTPAKEPGLSVPLSLTINVIPILHRPTEEYG